MLCSEEGLSDLESSLCACLPGCLFSACVRVCAVLSGSKAIWKHGRSFLHLFAPSALSTAYIAVGRKGKGKMVGRRYTEQVKNSKWLSEACCV